MKKFFKEVLNFCHLIPFFFRGNAIPFSSYIRHNVSLRKCKIGKYCYIGENSSLNNVITGNYCSLATNVYIGGMEHPIHKPSTSSRLFPEECISDNKTIIGNDVWVATSCVIRQGVKIGNGAVIGANSFVNKDVPAYAIVAGSPAKILRYRFDTSMQQQVQKTEYWRYNPPKAKEILANLNKQ